MHSLDFEAKRIESMVFFEPMSRLGLKKLIPAFCIAKVVLLLISSHSKQNLSVNPPKKSILYRCKLSRISSTQT